MYMYIDMYNMCFLIMIYGCFFLIYEVLSDKITILKFDNYFLILNRCCNILINYDTHTDVVITSSLSHTLLNKVLRTKG